ncbi:MAG TPA: hypothetical protein VJ785_07245 [Anaerolineales bacterium]|nr:hypothetical protein [Anaerolineales bacterium]
MKFIPWLHFLWKVPLCGLIFFIGFIPGGQLASWLGLPVPGLPAGADQATFTQYTLLVNLILAACLAALSLGISGSFLSRWLILFFFTWITYGVNNYLEASIFSTMSAASVYSVVLYLPASLFCSAAVAWLFPVRTQSISFPELARTFFAGRTVGNWAWRLFAAFLAFPLVYLFFGRLIAPIVLPYYRAGVNELTLPGWHQILPMAALRSLLFLLACLPILITWRYSNGRLFLTLSLALFLFVGGLAMLYAIWLVPVLRITHTLEILADEVVYTAALILLLRKPAAQPEAEQIPLPAH